MADDQGSTSGIRNGKGFADRRSSQAIIDDIAIVGCKAIGRGTGVAEDDIRRRGSLSVEGNARRRVIDGVIVDDQRTGLGIGVGGNECHSDNPTFIGLKGS